MYVNRGERMIASQDAQRATKMATVEDASELNRTNETTVPIDLHNKSEQRAIPVNDYASMGRGEKSGCCALVSRADSAYTYRVRFVICVIFVVLALIIVFVRNIASTGNDDQRRGTALLDATRTSAKLAVEQLDAARASTPI